MRNDQKQRNPRRYICNETRRCLVISKTTRELKHTLVKALTTTRFCRGSVRQKRTQGKVAGNFEEVMRRTVAGARMPRWIAALGTLLVAVIVAATCGLMNCHYTAR